MNVVELLTKLVSFNSVFEHEKEVMDWLEGYAQELGLKTNRLSIAEQRYNLLIERGTGTSLLCYGHIDTVPVYDGWKTDPFTLTAKGDKLYGLGACDMKGGIAGMLCAIATLPADVPIKLLLAVDEENDSAGSWHVVNERSDWLDGITHILSGEPGASASKIGGYDVLTLGRRGRARYIFRVYGVSAHGGHVERGASAITLATSLIKKLEAMPLADHKNLPKASHYVARVEGTSKGLSLPEYCEFEVDRHLVLPETADSALQEYTALAQEFVSTLDLSDSLAARVRVEVVIKPREHPYMEPYETAVEDPIVQQLISVVTKHGATPTFNYGRSVGDENVFANKRGIKPIILGPEGADIHSANEYVSQKSLQTCVDIYREFLLAHAKQNA